MAAAPFAACFVWGKCLLHFWQTSKRLWPAFFISFQTTNLTVPPPLLPGLSKNFLRVILWQMWQLTWHITCDQDSWTNYINGWDSCCFFPLVCVVTIHVFFADLFPLSQHEHSLCSLLFSLLDMYWYFMISKWCVDKSDAILPHLTAAQNIWRHRFKIVIEIKPKIVLQIKLTKNKVIKQD